MARPVELFKSNKDESPPMFETKWVDFFSRVHHTTPLWLFIPVIGYYIYKSFFVFEMGVINFGAYSFAGVAAWTLMEYVLHRWVFHFHPKSELGKKINFITHGVHHDFPNDSKRLVMVPSISIPLAFFFYFTIEAIVGSVYIAPTFVGFVSAYLFYDMLHYSVHHANFKNKWFQSIKKHHMWHHYRDPDAGFGFTTKFWDYVFNSNFKKEKPLN